MRGIPFNYNSFIFWLLPEFQNSATGKHAVQTRLELEADDENSNDESSIRKQSEESRKPRPKQSPKTKGPHQSYLAQKAVRTSRDGSPVTSGPQRPDHIGSHRQTLQIRQSRYGRRTTRHSRPDRPGLPVARWPVRCIDRSATNAASSSELKNKRPNSATGFQFGFQPSEVVRVCPRCNQESNVRVVV